MLSVALKQAFAPSLQSWDRVQSTEERCFVWQVITGRIPAALKERLPRTPLVRQVHDLPNFPSWHGHLVAGLPQEAFVLCPMWPGGWRGQRSVCFQGVRGLVSTNDLQEDLEQAVRLL